MWVQLTLMSLARQKINTCTLFVLVYYLNGLVCDRFISVQINPHVGFFLLSIHPRLGKSFQTKFYTETILVLCSAIFIPQAFGYVAEFIKLKLMRLHFFPDLLISLLYFFLGYILI